MRRKRALPITNARSAGVSELLRSVSRREKTERNCVVDAKSVRVYRLFLYVTTSMGGMPDVNAEKKRFALWISAEVLDAVRREYRADNCKSQSELIEKAVRLHLGRLAAGKTDAYLPAATAAVIEGLLTGFEDRIARLLFKQAVEESMMMNIIACDTDIDQAQLESLRGKCVADVKRTNGQISFRDVLKYQKTL